MHPSAPLAHVVVGQSPAWLDDVRVLAHQGGWDEILMVLVPVSVFAGLLYVANQRAIRMTARQSAGGTAQDSTAQDGTALDTAAQDSAAQDGAGDADHDVRRNERGGPI